ncbi:hypothetical protein [Xylanibacter muris]|uniref:hypothetical protein n=1 Tax=Xylanibacter muris TaxID=2736290 RepID=UPI001C130BE9|nr:hypothetical protein [Xylanibacter muris]
MIQTIGRAKRFSPNSEEKDAAILKCVGNMLSDKGYTVGFSCESGMKVDDGASIYVSMGREDSTLEFLRRKEREGCLVVNSSYSVGLCCNRRRLNRVLCNAGIPLPPEKGNNGYWLKRADGVAECRSDVKYAVDADAMRKTYSEMRACGISDIIVSAHVEGDLIKFYGVRGTGFFRTYYPGDDGISKFGDECINGIPHHYCYDRNWLCSLAERAAEAVGLDVYGGDCIVGSDGDIRIIDFNDWPSFSRCRDEAAEAIADRITYLVETVRAGKSLLQKQIEEIQK